MRGTRSVVLLTRPDHQASAMIGKLAALGMVAHNEPMLDIVPEEAPDGWWSGTAAIAITSPNGAKRLKDVAGLSRALPAFAVGPATAEELRKLGFADIVTGDGTAYSLMRLLQHHLTPETGEIVHVCGHHVACDIASELGVRGYRSKRVVLYRAELRQTLTETGRALGHANRIGAVAVTSQRAAKQLTLLLKKYGLLHITKSASAIAMSEPIADRLTGDGWQRVDVASEPSAQAIVETLMRSAHSLGLLP